MVTMCWWSFSRAPNAIRTPTLWVRWAVSNDTTEYSPTIATSNAIDPKTTKSEAPRRQVEGGDVVRE